MRISGIISAVVLAAALSLSSCGGKTEPVVVDCAALASELLEQVEFDDELAPLDAEAVKYMYGTDGFVSAYVYCGSGATAEEIAVFETESDEAGEAMYRAALDHIDDQTASFKNYVPAELSRLERAVVKRSGKYVALCVTGDDSDAARIINGAFGG